MPKIGTRDHFILVSAVLFGCADNGVGIVLDANHGGKLAAVRIFCAWMGTRALNFDVLLVVVVFTGPQGLF